MLIHTTLPSPALEHLIRLSPIAVAEESHGLPVDVCATLRGSSVRIPFNGPELICMALQGMLSPLVLPVEVQS
jgi:hypothetical protein